MTHGPGTQARHAARPPRVLVQPSYGNPISRGNWQATLAQPVPLDRVADVVTPHTLSALRRAVDALNGQG